jgi:hypothetical protein
VALEEEYSLPQAPVWLDAQETLALVIKMARCRI